MSHFSVLVLSRPGQSVDQLLLPYMENCCEEPPRCSRCGLWVDVDMTPEFKEVKADAMDYYNGIKNGIERGEYHGQELLPDAR